MELLFVAVWGLIYYILIAFTMNSFKYKSHYTYIYDTLLLGCNMPGILGSPPLLFILPLNCTPTNTKNRKTKRLHKYIILRHSLIFYQSNTALTIDVTPFPHHQLPPQHAPPFYTPPTHHPPPHHAPSYHTLPTHHSAPPHPAPLHQPPPTPHPKPQHPAPLHHAPSKHYPTPPHASPPTHPPSIEHHVSKWILVFNALAKPTNIYYCGVEYF